MTFTVTRGTGPRFTVRIGTLTGYIPQVDDVLETETGDYLLLETGDYLAA